MRLIDADKLIRQLEILKEHGLTIWSLDKVIEFIKQMPTVNNSENDAIQYSLGYQDGFLAKQKDTE